MSSTALERADSARADVALFPGATAEEIIAVATDAANKFSDVVKQRRMAKRIGENDHIQIEAWQTIGALTGVLADEGEVTELPWPPIEPLGEEPPFPEGREPRDKDSPKWREWNEADKTRRAWELHRDLLRARAIGRAFGFTAAFRAVKGGAGVGWGEGRCTRGEASKVNQEDYALSSMAQTRGQSRALGAPLKFVVKLAGYETTPAEELDGTAPSAPDPAQAERIKQLEGELTAAHQALAKAGEAAGGRPGSTSKWGKEADDKQINQAANLVRAIAHPTEIPGEEFIKAMGVHFDGVPEVCVTMLRGLARFIGEARAAGGQPRPEPPSNFGQVPDEKIAPPGHYQSD